MIIAIFYSSDLSYLNLFLMFASFMVLMAMNKLGVVKFIPYLLVGLFMWFFTYKSGIHATISGVLLAISIPHKLKMSHHESLLIKLEHTIAPYVAFLIMPIFALANAGVNLDGLSKEKLLDTVTLGVCLGLFVGKQLGVFVFSAAAIKLGFAEKPTNANWLGLYGVGVLTGIGFTMSLFVGNLAFANNTGYMDEVKIGVLLGSLFSTLLGYFILIIATRKNLIPA